MARTSIVNMIALFVVVFAFASLMLAQSADAQLGVADPTLSGTILQAYGGGLQQVGGSAFNSVAYAPSPSLGYFGRRR